MGILESKFREFKDKRNFKRKNIRGISPSIFETLAPFSLAGIEGEAKVLRVIDGDTIVLEDKTKLRLSGIDCPEKGERWWDEGKLLAEEMLVGKPIKYLPHGPDKYGRTLATVFVDGNDFGLLLVKKGLAKCYENSKTYLAEQAEAQEKKLCIWENYEQN
jgi:endonuclease YncB( thermonuclease family)